MTLVADMIRDAYRESNIIAIADTLTPFQLNEGLTRLRSLLQSAYRTVYKTDDDLVIAAGVLPFTPASEWPFPEEFDDYFIIGLALRINPRNGAPLDPQSVERYKYVRSRFKAYYATTKQIGVEYPLLYRYNEGYYSDDSFETGQVLINEGSAIVISENQYIFEEGN